MALATKCPYCHTTFRVAHDQLKLRAGLVRCGACKQIFNGVENLLGPEPLPSPAPGQATPAVQVPPAAALPSSGLPSQAKPAVTASSSPGISAMPLAAGEAAPSSLKLSPPVAHPAEVGDSTPSDGTDRDVDPLTRMTLMDFSVFDGSKGDAPPHEDALSNATTSGTVDPSTPDVIEQAIEDLQKRPWRETKKTLKEGEPGSTVYDEEVSEPQFVQHARRRQKVSTALKWLYGIGSVLLALLLLAQLTYTFRAQLAQRLPQSAPLLQQACGLLGCSIGLPKPIQALSIESSELQALPSQAEAFLLQALLRNRYDTAVAWPHLELTLHDAQGKPVTRRVFAPAEYLASSVQITEGFAAQSEHALKLHFVLEGIRASDFRVYLFYP